MKINSQITFTVSNTSRLEGGKKANSGGGTRRTELLDEMKLFFARFFFIVVAIVPAAHRNARGGEARELKPGGQDNC